MQRRTLIASAAMVGTALVQMPGAVLAQTVHAAVSGSATGAGSSAHLPPVQVAEVIPGAVFSGATRMRFLGFDVYDAALWVAPGFQAAQYGQSPLILELTYLRSLNGRSIAQRSIDEMRRAGSFNAEQEARWLAAMQTVFPDVKAGDRITGVHNPLTGARFWLNGLARAPIADPEFSRLFFGIWLSSATSEPKLRSALLANLPKAAL